MDKSNTYMNDELQAVNGPMAMEIELGSSDVPRQKIDVFSKNWTSSAEFRIPFKPDCDERKYLDNHLKEDKDKSLHQMTSQRNSEVDIGNHESSIESLDSYIHLKEDKDKRQHERTIQVNSEVDTYMHESNIESLDMDKCKSLHDRTIQVNSDVDIDMHEHEMETMDIDRYKSLLMKTIQVNSEVDSDMHESNIEYLVKYMVDKISEEDPKSLSESEAPNLKIPIQISTDSANWDLEDSTETIKSKFWELNKPTGAGSESASEDFMDFSKAVTQTTAKAISEVSSIRINNPAIAIRNTENVPRQRRVYSEKTEFLRGYTIQQIKDRELLLKLSIMEGKYSKDLSTKMRCIKKAENLQNRIDKLFDVLEDIQKMPNNPKGFKGCTSKSKTKGKKAKWTEYRLESFSSFFLRLYQSQNSESKDEKNFFENVDPKKLMETWEEFLTLKKKHEHISQLSKRIAEHLVADLHVTLVKCQQKMKCKISFPKTRSLQDYRNFFNELKLAVNENLDCLNTLLPIATRVIEPLMTYLSQSRLKILEIFDFLNEEREDVFKF